MKKSWKINSNGYEVGSALEIDRIHHRDYSCIRLDRMMAMDRRNSFAGVDKMQYRTVSCN